MKRSSLILLLFLLLSLTGMAQQTFTWPATPSQPVSKTLALESSWSGLASVTAYYSQGGRAVPATLQPSLSRSGNTLTVMFSSSNTAGLGQLTYVEVKTGSTLRYLGYLSLSPSAVIPPITSLPGSATNLFTKSGVNYLYQRSATGDETPVRIDPRANAITVTHSLSGFRSTTFVSGQEPRTIVIAQSDDKILSPGTFTLDSTDTTSPDDGSMILVKNNKRYRRNHELFQNANMFGYTARLTDPSDTVALKLQTAALQKAIDYTIKSANPAVYNSASPSMKRDATLYIPAGLGFIYGKLSIHGAIRIIGDGGLSYGGTLLFQVKNHTPIFELAPDTDGGSNCLQLENMRLRGPTPGVLSASTISVPVGVAAHSLHLNHIWGQGWEEHFLDIKGSADDLWVYDCVFDGTQGGSAASLGSSSGIVTNAKFSRNTFYNIPSGIDLIKTANVLIDGNTAYATSGTPGAFVNAALTGSQSLSGLSITNNTVNGFSPLLWTKSGGFAVTGNTHNNITGPSLLLDGGSVITGGTFVGNSLQGTWSSKVLTGSDTVFQAPIRAYATGLAGVTIRDNTITGGAGSLMAAFAPDSRNSGNIIDVSTATGFSRPSAIVGGGYRLSPVSTPPASATAPGTPGDVRITSTFMYVCVAANSWVRTALNTW